jgi:U3 small nucleolar RNA-associated protein 18
MLLCSIAHLSRTCSDRVVTLHSQKQNQLKLIHVPSCTVFTNWPTQQTPFQKVECMAFSGAQGSGATGRGGGGYFAVGNNTGKVLLYQLAHFGSA